MTFPFEIDNAIRSLMETRGGLGSVQTLALPALVDDHVEKAIVFDAGAQPRLMVMWSPVRYPQAAGDSGLKAQAARDCLGEQAGAAVLAPLLIGEADGRSFTITPFQQPLRPGGVLGRWDKFRMRPAVMRWLREVVRVTATLPDRLGIEHDFVQPLQRLADHPAVSTRVRSAANMALRDLHGGLWAPRWVLAHNDLWIGNLLRSAHDHPATHGFAVIDWGGSALRGHPMYDLMRVAMSMRLPRASFQREVQAHNALLQSGPEHACHHLAGALADLADHLGEWPVTRFAAAADECLAELERLR